LDNNISEVFKTILSNNSTSSTNKESSKESLNITPEMIAQLANTIKSNNSSNDTNNTSSSDSGNNLDLDFDTILKIKNIIEAFNKKDDAKSNLLYSLKPYLRESRQKKIDQYINLFKLSGITKLLKKEKGDVI